MAVKKSRAVPGRRGAFVDQGWGAVFIDPKGPDRSGEYLYIAVPRRHLTEGMTYKEALKVLLDGQALGFHGKDSAGDKPLTRATVFTWNVGPPPPPLVTEEE